MKKNLQARTIPGKALFFLLGLICSFNSFAQPANDIFTTATLLTPNTTCVTTAGNMQGATVSSPVVPTSCGTAGADVWYQFVASSAFPTISLGSLGTSFTPAAGNPRIQLMVGSFGSLTSLACVSAATMNVAAAYPTGLVPGNIYYIRVYTNTVSPAGANWLFTICITDPSNDNCANAVLLISATSCNNIAGTMTGATYTAITGVPGCGTGGSLFDTWYKFVAQSTNPVISMSTSVTNQRMTLFTGDCSGFTASQCGTTVINATGLTIGDTYYIRLYSTSNATGATRICITDFGRLIGGGNSYVNKSKKTTGGPVQNGDTLEIRSSYYWHSNYDLGNTITLARFYDSLPTNTTLVTAAGAGDTLLRLITNEGNKINNATRFTATLGDDGGSFNAAPGLGKYQVRMNVSNAPAAASITASVAGDLTNTTGATGAGGTIDPNTTLPRAQTGTLITTSYLVKVSGAAGQIIKLATSKLVYRKGSTSTDTTINGTPYQIMISGVNSAGLCPNSVGLNIASENLGTFGTGNTQVRSNTLAVTIPAYLWRPSINSTYALGDGYYSIVNNLSPTGGTNAAAWSQTSGTSCTGAPVGFECTQRMHSGFWDVIGDHTGTNNAAGNPASPLGSSGGYMLAVNADVVMSDAFKQTLPGLCPNTYYEYSAWMRNVCKTCGRNVNDVATYNPGVLPNLTFSVNGMDYYSTGSIDTVGWVKKGFVFQTDSTGNPVTIAIRNNAPGGGGNDWTMDDISISVCLPNMKYSPSLNPNVCRMNPVTIDDTVRSIFNNYTYYKWQRSTDGGTNWTDVTGPLGPASPTFNGTTYTYITSYTIPPAATDTSNSGDLYRVIVGTSLLNLGSVSCQATDGISIITLQVNNCGVPLKTDLLSFNGKLVLDKGHLSWTTSKEEEPLTFTVERSNDGNYFTPIGTVNSYNNYTSVNNSYSFIDPVPVNGKVFYRLGMKDHSAAQKYSRIIQLNRDNESFGLSNIINPFNYAIEFDVTSATDGKIDVELIDLLGKTVRKSSYVIHAGVNALSLPNTDNLPSGTYIFRVKNNEILINKKVLKKNF